MPPDAEALLDHAAFLRGLARSLVVDEARADDVVQEAWLTALRRRPRDPARLRAWLGTIVRNFAFRSRRDERVRGGYEQAVPPAADVPTPREILEREETRRRVVLAVLGLEEPYRSTVVLHYLEELPPRAVARRLGVPVETVRTRIKRARAQLRERLDAAHDGDRRAWALALVPLAAAASHAAALTTGVLLMSTKTKVAALAAVSLVALIALVGTRGDADSGERAHAPRAADRIPSSPLPTAAEPVAPSPEEALVAPPAPASGLVVRVTADGAPLDDAYVALHDGDSRVEHRFDGPYHFDRTGEFTLRVAHAEWGPVAREVRVPDGAPVQIEVALKAAPSIEIRVTDAESGSPVAGAEVLLTFAGGLGKARNVAIEKTLESVLTGDGDIYPIARRLAAYDSVISFMGVMQGDQAVHVPQRFTDARGRARLGGLLPGRFQAIVSHDDYPSVLVQHNEIEAGRLYEVALRRGATLTVLAPRVEGRIPEGFTCELDRAGIIPFPIDSVEVDADGRARFERLAPGHYIVALSPDGSWDISLSSTTVDEEGEKRTMSAGRKQTAVVVQRNVHVAAATDQVLDLRGATGAVVRGTIAGESSGWTVRLMEGEEFASERADATTDAEGRFRFSNVPPGPYRVVANGEGGGSALEEEIQVSSGDDEVEVVLRPARGRIEGLVTGETGDPVEGATIMLFERARATRPVRTLNDLIGVIFGRAESGADGNYRVERLAAGDYVLFCGHGGALARHEVSLAEGGIARVDVSLAPSHLHRATLRLRDASGDAVRGFIVIQDPTVGLASAILADEEMLDPAAEPVAERSLLLSAGRYTVDVYAEGFAAVRGLALEVNGDDEKTVRLQRGVRVELIVLGSGGPLPGEEIELHDAAGRLVHPGTKPFRVLLEGGAWRADGSGRVRIEHVARGAYTVWRAGKKVATLRVGDENVVRRVRIE